MTNKQSFNDFFIAQISKSSAKRAVLDFFNYKQSDILESDITKELFIRWNDYVDERAGSSNTKRLYTTLFGGALRKAILYDYQLDEKIVKSLSELSKWKQQPSESVYLNKDEIKQLVEYEPANEPERFARNLFVLAAYTGVRCSDAQILTENNILNNELTYTSIKTSTTAHVPLHPIVPKLMAELKGKMNYDPDSVRTVIGERMKVICRKLGMTQKMTMFRRGVRTTAEKCDMVSMHTARHSFATNLLLCGYLTPQISSMMGHSGTKAEAMTSAYFCVSHSEIYEQTKDYLIPNSDNDKSFNQIRQMIDGGLAQSKALEMMAIIGTSTTEIQRLITKLNLTA